MQSDTSIARKVKNDRNVEVAVTILQNQFMLLPSPVTQHIDDHILSVLHSILHRKATCSYYFLKH